MAPADTVEAWAKNGFREEAADRIPGTDGLFDAQRMEEVEYVGGSPHRNHSTNCNHSHRQVKVNRTLKINLVLFSSITTSAAQRSAFSFVMSAVTAPAEIRAMVNTRSDWCSLFEEFLTKYDNTLAYFPQLGRRYTNRNSQLCVYK